MVSITGVTNKYILQPSLVEKHRKTLEVLAETIIWKVELKVMQKVLENVSLAASQVDDKKKMGHFQNLIMYYSGEVVIEIRKKMRAHEDKLAKMLEINAEWDIEYFKEHDVLMGDAEAVRTRLAEIKTELLVWIDKLKANNET